MLAHNAPDTTTPTELLRQDDAVLTVQPYKNTDLLDIIIAEATQDFVVEPAITVFGKPARQPRDVQFRSDESQGYFYSGQCMPAKQLTKHMKELLDDVNRMYNAEFNGILMNRYVDGTKTVGSHADSEDGLHPEAGVVAISYGATRKFRIRDAKTKRIVGDFPARHGEILQMKGSFQKTFYHEIPKETKVTAERISFTFRRHDAAKEAQLLARINKRKRE